MNPFVIAFRRIIYSIPLKRLLLLLAVFGVLFACFSSAENVGDLITYIGTQSSISIPSNSSVSILDNINHSDTYCLDIISANNTFEYGFNSTISPDSRFSVRAGRTVKYVCLTPYTPESNYLVISNPWGASIDITYKLFKLNVLLGTNIPIMSSIQCQTEYNLIPVESVDQNYCTSNNLCPTYDCPTNPIGTGTLSNLYINNILHVGAPNIIMNIPDEIDWDYAYTQGGQNMNIDVVGYNQDFEKIEGWIETNNYKPTSDDFTNIFKNFSNFGGLLVGALFVILVFYFVKKMFK